MDRNFEFVPSPDAAGRWVTSKGIMALCGRRTEPVARDKDSDGAGESCWHGDGGEGWHEGVLEIVGSI